MANPGGNESLPCRASPEAISVALGRVAASYVGAKSLSQRLIAGDRSITELPVMPGLIQTMVGEKLAGSVQDKGKAKTKTVVSGVVYSNENTSRLQSTYGHGEYVVNSKGKVDNFYITKDGLVYSEIMPKNFRLKPVDKTTDGKTKINLERVDNEASLKYSPSLDVAGVVYLHELSKFFEQHYGKRIDLEFVYNLADPTDSNSKPTINIVQALGPS